MNYTICSNENEILSTVWNVYASFGYVEACEGGECTADNGMISRLFFGNSAKECRAVMCGQMSAKAISEVVASAIEAALAVGFPDYTIEVRTNDAKVSELIYLYSLDEYASFSEGEFSLCAKSGENVIMKGEIKDGDVICTYDLHAAATAMHDSPLAQIPSKTVIYAEKNAEGIAYEISYTLRLMGCMAEGDVKSDSIEQSDKYALSCGASDLIRVFPDGKLQIKSLADGEITETDYETFVGYYDDGGDDCGCGEHHHHDEGCDCGHCH